MLIPTFSVAFYNIFYSMSGKNGSLRDKAQHTDILSKAHGKCFDLFYDSGNTNKKWLISITSMTSG